MEKRPDGTVILTDRGTNWIRTVEKHPEKETVQTITYSSGPVAKSVRTFHKDGSITRTVSYLDGTEKTETLPSIS